MQVVDTNVGLWPATTTAAASLEAITKALRTSTGSLAVRLSPVVAADFPKKDEFVARYLLEVLPRLQQDDLARAWLVLADCFDALRPDTTLALLRRGKLVEGIEHALRLAQDDVTLRSIGRVVKAVARHRPLRKVCLTTLDAAISLVGAAAGALARHDTHDCRALAEQLVDLALYCTKQRYTPRKVIEGVGARLPEFVQAGCVHEPIGRFLRSTIFAQSAFQDYLTAYTSDKPNVHVLGLSSVLASCAGQDVVPLAKFTFELVKTALDFSPAKLVQVWHMLLLGWLEAAREGERVAVVAAMRDVLGPTTISRFLSGDERVRSALEDLLDRTTDMDRSLALLHHLVVLDPDLVLPSRSPQIFTLLCQSGKAADRHAFEVDLARAHTQIRTLPEFLRSVGELPLDAHGDNNLGLLRLLSAELARSSTSAREAAVTTLLDCVDRSDHDVRALQLLSAAVSSFPIGHALEKFNDHLLTVLSGSGSKHGNAARDQLRSCLYERCTDFPKATPASTEGDLAMQAQAACRSLELGGTVTDALVIVRATSHDHRLCAVLVDRFLPVLIPRLTKEQTGQLIEACAMHGLLGRPALLENDAMHMPLQDYLLDQATRGDLTMLQNVPAQFYHKAYRQRIVAALVTRRGPLSGRLLLRFCRAGTFCKFNEASVDAFDTFWRQFVDGAGAAADELGRLYLAQLDDEHRAGLLASTTAAPMLVSRLYDLAPDRQSLQDTRDRLLDLAADALPSTAALAFELLDCLSRHDAAHTRRSVETRCSQDLFELVLDHVGLRQDVAASGLSVLGRQAVDLVSAKRLIQLIDENEMLQGAADGAFERMIGTLPQEELVELIGSLHGVSERTSLRLCTAVSAHTKASTAFLVPRFVETAEAIDGENGLLNWPSRHAFLQDMLDRHHRVLRLEQIDVVFTAIGAALEALAKPDEHEAAHIAAFGAEVIYIACCQLLRAIFEHAAHFLRDRYHIVVHLFCRLLSVNIGAVALGSLAPIGIWPTQTSTSQLCRAWDTFVGSCRRSSGNPGQFDRAVAKHLVPLLIEYVFTTYESASIAGSEATLAELVQQRKRCKEAFFWPVLTLATNHERDAVMGHLDPGRRAMWKRLSDEYEQDGQWRER